MPAPRPRPNVFLLRRTITQEVTLSPQEVAEYLGLPTPPDPATVDLNALLNAFNDDTEAEDALFDADLSDATGNELDILPAFTPLPDPTPLQGHWLRSWPSGNYVRDYSPRVSANVKPAPGDAPRHIWTATIDAGHIMHSTTAPTLAAAQQAADTYVAATVTLT